MRKELTMRLSLLHFVRLSDMKRDLKALRRVFLSGFSSILLVSGLLWPPAEARAEVVYDNCLLPYDQFWGDPKEFGDEINHFPPRWSFHR